MRFTVDGQPLEDIPVNITLKLSQYYGMKLPTLYANDIPILHISKDGSIVVRSGRDTDLFNLIKIGFQEDPVCGLNVTYSHLLFQ